MARERDGLSHQEKGGQLEDFVGSGLDELNSRLDTLSQCQADQFQELAGALRVLSEQIEVLRAEVEERRINRAHAAPNDQPASVSQEVTSTAAATPSSQVQVEHRKRAPKSPQGRLF